ncbi:MAG TPA: MFS transporter [Cellulomonas sp.]
MRRQVPLIVSCAATFLLLAYSTIVTVAMPMIAADLRTGFGALQWVIGVYPIALAALLVPAGALSDRIGRRTLLVGGLALFAAASLACALAPDVVTLVLARLVQGVAGAALFASTLPLLDASYTGHDKRRAFAVWGAVSGLAAAVGNVSGGLLSAFGWRSVFAVGVPLALLAAVLTAALVPEGRTDDPAPLDLLATGLLAATVGGFVVAALVLADQGPSPALLAIVVACACLGTALVVRQRRHPGTAPIGPALARSPVLRAAAVVAAAYYFAAFGVLPAVSSWLQDALGLTPVSTALVLSVQPVAFFVTSAALGTRLGRLSRRRVLTLGLAICGLGCLALALPGLTPGWRAVVPAMLATGVGAGIISPVLPAAAMQGVAANRTGVAASTVNAARQLGISLGVAGCAVVVRLQQPGTDPALWPRTLTSIALLAGGVCAAAAVGTAVVLRRAPVGRAGDLGLTGASDVHRLNG